MNLETEDEKWVVSDEDRTQTLEMSRLGVSMADIAILLNQEDDEVATNCRRELELGPAETNYKALKVLQSLVLNGDYPSATMFWVKTRCCVTSARTRPSDDLSSQDLYGDFPVRSNSGEPPKLR